MRELARRFALLRVFAALAGMAAALPLAPSPASAFDADLLTRPANPYVLPVEADENHQETKEIGREGGAITVSDESGMTYTLTIPRGALRSAVYITIAPAKAGPETPKELGRIAGVVMKPDGTEFDLPAVLSIKSEAPFGTESSLAFSLEKLGEAASLVPMRRNGNEILVPVMHFSSEVISEQTLDKLFKEIAKSAPVPEFERMLHGLVTAAETARREGRDVEKAKADFMNEFGAYGLLSSIGQLSAAGKIMKKGPVGACRAAFESLVGLVPFVRMAMAAEAIKFVEPQGRTLTVEQVGELVGSIKMDDARVLTNSSAVNGLAKRCLDFAASECARWGFFSGLIDVYRAIGLASGAAVKALTTNSDGTPSSSASIFKTMFDSATQAQMVRDALPKLDPKLQPAAEKMISWLDAYAKIGDPAQFRERVLAQLAECARYKVKWRSDARNYGLVAGDARDETRFVGEFEADLTFEPGFAGDPILTGEVRGAGLGDYPVFGERITQPTDFLSERIVGELRDLGVFEAKIVSMENGNLDLRAIEPGGMWDWEQCWKVTGCQTNIGGGTPLTVTYDAAGKMAQGWMRVTDLPRSGFPYHPVLFEGTIKTHFRFSTGDYDFDDVSDISVTHTGGGDTSLVEEQAAKEIRDFFCKEFRGGGTRDCQ